MNIIKTPSPNFNERPSAIDAIIIHYTDMVSPEAALAWLTNPLSNVSAHYLIDEGGQIFQMVDENQRAWHAGESSWQGRTKLNDCTIGIELANPGHSHGYTPFPETQIVSLIELCLDIQQKWSIPSNRILGHSDIAPQRKQDPGHLFPWERLAREGLGLWPEKTSLREAEGDEAIQFFNASGLLRPDNFGLAMTTEDLQAMLSQVGYDTRSPPHALIAFQRHFQPHKVDGIADQETYTLLQKIL